MKTKGADPTIDFNAFQLKQAGQEALAKQSEDLIEAIREADVPAEHVLDWFRAEYPGRDIDELHTALRLIHGRTRSHVEREHAYTAALAIMGDTYGTPLDTVDLPTDYERRDSTRQGVFNATGIGRQLRSAVQDEIVHMTKTGDNHPTMLRAKLEEAYPNRGKDLRAEYRKAIDVGVGHFFENYYYSASEDIARLSVLNAVQFLEDANRSSDDAEARAPEGADAAALESVVRWWAENRADSKTYDWQMGEEAWTPRADIEALRHFDPSAMPDDEE